jgi:hypothetical protein
VTLIRRQRPAPDEAVDDPSRKRGVVAVEVMAAFGLDHLGVTQQDAGALVLIIGTVEALQQTRVEPLQFRSDRKGIAVRRAA